MFRKLLALITGLFGKQIVYIATEDRTVTYLRFATPTEYGLRVKHPHYPLTGRILCFDGGETSNETFTMWSSKKIVPISPDKLLYEDYLENKARRERNNTYAR